MIKKIALRAGKPPTKYYGLHQSAIKNINATNAGNMVFSESAYKILSTPQVTIETLGYNIHERDPVWINENFDILVLPLANAFRIHWKNTLEEYTRFISKLKIPVVVMGVGIQTDFEYNMENLDPIKKEVKDFVSVVLDHSPNIGVRGEATKIFLEKLGFSDSCITVIGCPSMYRYGEKFSIDPDKLKNNRGSNLALNISSSGFNSFGFKTGKNNIIDILDYNMNKYSQTDVILQNNYSLKAMLWGRKAEENIEYDGVSTKTKKMLDEGHAKFFVDPTTWIKFLSIKDFSMGTRIHGNITALLAGTPSFVLSTDSRTREICEYFHIPFQHIDTIGNKFDFNDFRGKADYTKLLNSYPEKFKTFKSFLNKNNLQTCFDYENMAADFEQKLDAMNFPEPASGVNTGYSLKYRYLLARIKNKSAKLMNSN